MKNIMILAGGTGGHIFPALAVANALKDQGHQVFWLGTPYGMEGKLVPQHGFSLDVVPIQNLRGKGWKRYLRLPFHLLRAVWLARRILKQRQIQLVVGFGGYVAGPGALAAKWLHLPLIIHEQNAVPGMTNRYLSKIADHVLMGFPASFKGLSTAIYTGNPIRKDLLPLADEDYCPHQPLHVLVLGGSLGAEALNQVVPEALAQMEPELRPLLWQQTGEKLFEATQKRLAFRPEFELEPDVLIASYAGRRPSMSEQAAPSARAQTQAGKIRLAPFIDDMNQAYQWADVVICRSGALSVSELAVVGKPAIFIPYPQAVDDHQRKNAEISSHAGASILILQSDLTPQVLAEQLSCFSKNPDLLSNMAKKMKSLSKPQATQEVLEVLSRLLSTHKI